MGVNEIITIAGAYRPITASVNDVIATRSVEVFNIGKSPGSSFAGACQYVCTQREIKDSTRYAFPIILQE
jgi:hypothetical protein